MILVSACLMGIDAKYNGKNNINPLIIEYSSYGKFIPVCPEQLGGLSTPRFCAEILRGSGKDVVMGLCNVINSQGRDVTKEFLKGANEVIKITKLLPIKAAILKQNSPSCGSSFIYDGSFSKRLKEGEGVTAYLLRENNIPIFSEEDITKELLERLIFNDK